MKSTNGNTTFPVLFALSLPGCYFLWFLISGFLIGIWFPLQEPVSIREGWYFLIGGGWIGLWSAMATILYTGRMSGLVLTPLRAFGALIINFLGSMMILLARVLLEIPWAPWKPMYALILYFILVVIVGGFVAVLSLMTVKRTLRHHRLWVAATMVGWALAVMMDIFISFLSMSVPLVNQMDQAVVWFVNAQVSLLTPLGVVNASDSNRTSVFTVVLGAAVYTLFVTGFALIAQRRRLGWVTVLKVFLINFAVIASLLASLQLFLPVLARVADIGFWLEIVLIAVSGVIAGYLHWVTLTTRVGSRSSWIIGSTVAWLVSAGIGVVLLFLTFPKQQ